MPTRKIRVLVVDDSLVFRTTLTRFLTDEKFIDVVGSAGDAYEARDKIIQLRPDVLTLDVEMPKMNGIQFLKKLMPQYPLPTVIVSSAPIMAFEALDAGAVEFVRKPSVKTSKDIQAFAIELRGKIITASHAKVKKTADKPSIVNQKSKISTNIDNNIVIALGASTGGTEALQTVLTQMPENSPPIVVVQHMPPVFTQMFAERLNKICSLNITEAKNRDRLKRGHVLIAPGDFQMTLASDSSGYYVKVAQGEKVSGHCPSVDVLFSSVALTAKENAVGVIMTGMGADGAQGLLKMRDAGAYTIGQDKETCVVYGMPMVAHKLGACTIQAPLDRISSEICRYISER